MAPFASQLLKPSLFSINSTWQILGPFQIGTREATWGADPLEYLGGFGTLSYDTSASFRSSLSVDGIARWNISEASVQTSYNTANASLSVAYSNVDWNFLKLVYGWAAVQFQAWARGELIIHGKETQHVILHTDAILEYWVDDQHYFGGDFYTFRSAPPVLRLKPGSHRLDIRLVRDVRALGGILEPTIDVVIDVQQASGTLELAKAGILMSDVVDGKLASSSASVTLRNSGVDDIEIIRIHGSNTIHSTYNANMTRIVIVAGQTRPIAFDVVLPAQNVSTLTYNITYRNINSTHTSTLQVYQDLKQIAMYQPHKVTYLHPGGIVSYTMLRPPARNATCHSGHKKLPILLGLHGAGLEADDPMVAGALDPVSDLCVWVLFPTGVTPWSGDDWHNWGFADVEAAIQVIPSWIERIGWTGPDVDIDRWIVTGHSNGGQGTWYTLTHRPDKIIAAAPVSGYASIQKYVPYELWQPADPRRMAVLSASLNSYRHEMLMSNVRGIPVQQQHGEIDDNVPAYHSRFLAHQLHLAGVNSSYNEVPQQNHWWDTVMTTPELVDFYYTQAQNDDALPRRLEEFTFVVGDPSDMGTKGGIKVLELKDPGQYGKVVVRGHLIKTTNVASLEFDPLLWTDGIVINGRSISPTELTAPISLPHSISNGGSTAETSMSHRHGRQLGSMTAILRTRGPFVIRHSGTTRTSDVALQISRNLHQYFQADAAISSSFFRPEDTGATGNIITLLINEQPPAPISEFPVQVGRALCSVVDHNGDRQDFGTTARGAAYLRPAGDERLELVLWGINEDGLRQAARIVPMMTGVGQPDFVVFGESAKWRGVEGVLAMGFFDASWHVTASSVVEVGS
ncbi:hypothetical protein DE146DRAFT_603008 [Phaeosphaeria sp. MPI-PUGE-AT-0046c]|nr:hypothetical protein DE146DRAFT_603008 [Phaeosphaeria sp. MPI-PUGE-AT-0046c]